MGKTGIGFDAHAFENPGDDARPLILGGVQIDGHPGLSGHSDADVLSHAVADALLGAAGLGDLGSRFPDDDRWAGASSLSILEETATLVASEGFLIEHVDASVVAQTPRLAPFRDLMRERVAEALGISVAEVSIKATTTDGLGFTGRAEGIAALAVASIERAARA